VEFFHVVIAATAAAAAAVVKYAELVSSYRAWLGMAPMMGDIFDFSTCGVDECGSRALLR